MSGDFDELVAEVLEELPPEIRERIDNVVFVIEDWPSPSILRKAKARRECLLGFYEGIPLSERGAWYNLALPDRIFIFRKPIELHCRLTGRSLREEIRRTLLHEIGHHFGMSEEELLPTSPRRDRKPGRPGKRSSSPRSSEWSSRGKPPPRTP